jgi:putative FmdB family regulatory protein
MPVYEYRCKQCGKHHEIAQGFHDERPTTCASCGGHLARVFHPVGVVFKGSGFHKNDYTSSGARTEPAASGPGSKSSGDGKAGESKATEGKSEAKTDSKPTSEAKPSSSSGGASKTGSGGT